MRPSSPHFHPKSKDKPDPTRKIPNPNLPGLMRKKGLVVRPWLRIESTGQAQVVQAGKQLIMRKTGLPARDLRVLDPLLSYPSTILGRDKAIVINLEHIKAVITAQEVWLLNSTDPLVIPLAEELQRRLLRLHHATKAREVGVNEDDTNWTNLSDLEEPRSAEASPTNLSGGFPQPQEADVEGKAEGKQGAENQDGLKVLPFEFIALEACLEAACSCLESEARTLEQEAHTALDKLVSKISTLNLERVRQIKSRLVAITGRVHKVRDELEHLVDDEEDMAEMYLTEKMAQQLENSSVSSMREKDDMDDGVLMNERIPADLSTEAHWSSIGYEGDLNMGDNTHEHFNSVQSALDRDSHGTCSSTTHSAPSKQLVVEELEMLLEAYFKQIDGTLNKLSTLREYVDDTEDYLNIMLDDKQNQLLQMGIMMITATLAINAFVVVTGIFGMNIDIDLFGKENAGLPEFLWTVGSCTAGTFFLYSMAIAWCKHKRLLD